MNRYQLELFCEIARVKSFSKAAKLLHMSQPAVSAQIQAVEHFYGTSLFNRSSSGVTLNEFGELVHKYAKDILKLHEALEREIDRLIETDNKKLLVGASSSFGSYALPCGIWFFKEKFPHVEVNLEIGNAEKILAMLKEDKVHVALLEASFSDKMKDFVSQFASSDDLLVIAPPKKPWEERQNISLEELKKAPLIMREKGSGIREAFEKAIASQGLSLKDFNIKTEMSSTDAIKSTVEAGFGLSISSRVAVKKEIQNGMVHAMTIEELPIKVNYLVAYKNEQSLNSAGKKFVRLVAGQGNVFC